MVFHVGFVYSFFPCFPPLPSGATISTPTISTPSFLMFPRFPLSRFQSPRFAIGFGLCRPRTFTGGVGFAYLIKLFCWASRTIIKVIVSCQGERNLKRGAKELYCPFSFYLRVSLS